MVTSVQESEPHAPKFTLSDLLKLISSCADDPDAVSFFYDQLEIFIQQEEESRCVKNTHIVEYRSRFGRSDKSIVTGRPHHHDAWGAGAISGLGFRRGKSSR